VSASSRSLPGTFWGIVAAFATGPDSSGNATQRANFAEFADGVRRQGLRLLVVELAIGEGDYAIDAQWCDRLVRKRSSSVLWHKERLLNLALDALPPDCDKVAWLDGDILFLNPDWVGEATRCLEAHPVAQLFSEVCWLPRNRADLPAEPAMGLGEGKRMAGMAATLERCADRRRALLDFFQHGHCGFAWAARRDLLAGNPFYDRHVLGGGDVTLAHAFFGDEDYWRGLNPHCRGFTRAEQAAVGAWGRRFHASLNGTVGAVPGRILHLWHGATATRGYGERAKILRDNAFDPQADIAVDDAGCLRWNSDKPDLHRRVREYFAARADALAA